MGTIEEVRAKMTGFAQRQNTGQLCEALLALDAKTGRTPEESLSRGVLIDVLCTRHPEADAAFTAWAEDENSSPAGAARAIAAAARAAAERNG